MKIIIVPLMMLLISAKCSRVDVKLTCNRINSAAIESMPLCDVSFKKNRCRCRCFNLTKYKTVKDSECGEDFKKGDYPLETCEGISGFLVEEWAKEVRPNLKKLRNLKINLCK